MAETQIRFEDGLTYERYMGDWSRRAGAVFLDWLAIPSGLKWIDVGCGNGAFTELIIERCVPTEVVGIDPSAAQLDFARKRPSTPLAKFDRGDAMALPFSEDAFDVAIMALVIFLCPIPLKVSRKWRGWCGRAALLRPMPGTYWAVVSQWSRSVLNCGQWGLNL